jgi:hypothetical protein
MASRLTARFDPAFKMDFDTAAAILGAIWCCQLSVAIAKSSVLLRKVGRAEIKHSVTAVTSRESAHA